MMRSKAILLFFLGAYGCSLEADPGEPTFTGLEVVEEESGVYRLVVDASDEDAWVYFDFDSKSEVEAPADPKASLDWDLGFRRFLVKSNGGVSGLGGMSVAALAEVSFDEVTVAPVGGYLEDAPGQVDPDAPDEVIQDEVDYAFNVENDASSTGWFDYNPTDHTLSPAAVVYVVRTVEGCYYKLQFVRYYDGAGSPAILTLRFAEIPAAVGRIDVLPIPGPPGSGEFSGNPMLSAWSDDDPTTHTVSPRDVTFVVRRANGEFAKLRILGYAESALILSFAYAGPRRMTF